jgi:hypothetical protein
MKQIQGTRFVVKAGQDRPVTFMSRKEAEFYAKRCGKPRILTIPASR